MRRRGFNYSRPSDAVASLTAAYQVRGPPRALQRREIRTAVADLQCANAIEIVSVVDRIKLRYAQQLPKSDRLLLASLDDVRLEALKRAKAIVAAAS
jgi:hypothetical protein